MRHVAGIVAALGLALVPILPLPSLLFHSPGPGEPAGLRAVHDYDAPKWAFFAVVMLVLALVEAVRIFRASRARTNASEASFPVAAGLPILAALLFWTALSALWTANPSLTLDRAAHLSLVAGAFALLVPRVLDPGGATRVAGAFATSAAVIALYGILQRTGIDFASSPALDSRRAVSTLGNTNFASEVLVVAIPLLVGLVLDARRRLTEVLWALALGMTILHLMLTETRAGLVSLAAAVAVLGLLALRRQLDRSTLRKKAAILIGAATLALLALAAPALRGGAVVEKASTIADAEHPSTRVRLHLWESAIDMIADRPLHGYGAGNFGLAYPYYRTRVEAELSGYLSRVDTAHNDYLHLAVELGILGLALWLAFAATVTRRGLSRGNGDRAPHRTALECAAIASVAAFLVNGLFRNPLLNPAAALGFAAAAAIATAHAARLVPVHGLGARLAPAFALLAFLPAVVTQDRALRSDRHLRTALGWQDDAIRSTVPEEARRDLERAERSLRLAADAAPHDYETWFRIGQVTAALGDTDASAEAFRTALRVRPEDPTAASNLAVRLAGKGDLEGAREQLDRAVELAPLDPTIRFNRARLYEIEGQLADAVRTYEEASALRPRHIPTYDAIVSCYGRLQEENASSLLYFPLLEDANARKSVALALDRVDAGAPAEARRILEGIVAGDAPPEAYWALATLTDDTDTAAAHIVEARRRGLSDGSWVRREPTVRRLEERAAFRTALRDADQARVD